MGTVKLSNIQPAVGRPITAKLSDPDGGVTDEKWQWLSSNTEGGNYSDIDDATSATYTPKAAVMDNPATEGVNEARDSDEGLYLRAMVTYRDAQSIDDDGDTAAVEEGRRGVNNPGTQPDDDAVGEALVFRM